MNDDEHQTPIHTIREDIGTTPYHITTEVYKEQGHMKIVLNNYQSWTYNNISKSMIELQNLLIKDGKESKQQKQITHLVVSYSNKQNHLPKFLLKLPRAFQHLSEEGYHF